MPSGQVAAVIGAIEPCETLIARIVDEAVARLDALAAMRGAPAHACGIDHDATPDPSYAPLHEATRHPARDPLKQTTIIHQGRRHDRTHHSVRSLPFKIEREGGIGELVIDQPPVNALDARGWQALADASTRSAATTACT